MRDFKIYATIAFMLDKSIPYLKIFMKRDKNSSIIPYNLPKGFSYTYFKEGDEKAWAEIELSVGEFQTLEEGIALITKEIEQDKERLNNRIIFIENEKGEKVATGTAWREIDEEKGKVSRAHWIATRADYQGKGLGSAIFYKTLTTALEKEGESDVYLSTQTWSHVAIRMYIKQGFYITGERVFGKDNNDYPKNEEMLKELSLI